MAEILYWRTAGPIMQHRDFLHCEFLVELYHRLRVHPTVRVRVPKALQMVTIQDGGYCIDAPDAIPAGGCRWFPLEDPDDQDAGVPEQIFIEREAGT